jgi:hypothetical protein
MGLPESASDGIYPTPADELFRPAGAKAFSTRLGGKKGASPVFSQFIGVYRRSSAAEYFV